MQSRKQLCTEKDSCLGFFFFSIFFNSSISSNYFKLTISILPPCHLFFFLFRCMCTIGWTGPDCSEDINECDSEPCLNGATCYESVKQGQFVCICPPFYTGDFCHQRFSPCELPYNPCINNSTCLAQADGNPVCICKTGKNWCSFSCLFFCRKIANII